MTALELGERDVEMGMGTNGPPLVEPNAPVDTPLM
jgi:hypothetical protein